MYRDPLVAEAMGLPGHLYEGWASTKHSGINDVHPPLVATAWIDQALTTPWYVPLFYLPLLLGTYGGWLAFATGLGLWSAFEYCVHRFVYHGTWIGREGWYESPWLRALHCIWHGHHHRDPNDPLRVVHSPLLVLPTGFCISRVLPASIFIGFAWGYIVFELCHYALHQIAARPEHPWPFCSVMWAEMRQHHLAHHAYRASNKQGFNAEIPGTTHNFGVTTSFGDTLGSTLHVR